MLKTACNNTFLDLQEDIVDKMVGPNVSFILEVPLYYELALQGVGLEEP